MDISAIGSMLYLMERDVPLHKFSREFDVRNIRKNIQKNIKNLIWGNNILGEYMGFGYIPICTGFTIAKNTPTLPTPGLKRPRSDLKGLT